MVNKVVHYFDKLEDRIRARLSRYPLLYTLIGGIAIVLFWRGVWITADQLATNIPAHLVWIDGPLSVLISSFILLITGLFISFFINDTSILTGIKQEKKIMQRTEAEIEKESDTLHHIETEIKNIEHSIEEKK